MSQSAINNFTTFSPVIRLNVHKTRTHGAGRGEAAARVARTTGRGGSATKAITIKQTEYNALELRAARGEGGTKNVKKRNPSVCPHAC